MPLEMIEAQDPLSNLVEFKISPIYEMMSSLQVLRQPVRYTDWAEEVRLAVGNEFIEQLKVVYKPVQNGAAFFELGVDYPNHEDVLGFIDYVRQMSDATFLYYLLGRIIPLPEIERAEIDELNVNKLLNNTDQGFRHWMCIPIADWANDVSGFRTRLADLWEWYWTDYFAEFADSIRSIWLEGLQEKQNFFAREGGKVLFDMVSSHKQLPPHLPADQPYTSVTFVPLYLISKQAYMFYGYGNVTLLFDAQRTEQRIAEMEATKNAALNTVRALSDENRLRILQIIAHGEGHYNGKAIAAKLGLSASAVSRHLSQLKDGNLISEESVDNRNITYRLQRDTLTSLSPWLLDYIYS